MIRVDLDDLADGERVFMADLLRVAKAVEELLTAAGVEYAVAVEPVGRTLFGGVRMGAVFYVAGTQAGYCRQRLSEAGFERGIVYYEEEEE